MTLAVTFHPAAEDELTEATEYYDAQSPGLGTRFVAAVEATVAAICDHPRAGTMLSRTVRRRLVPGFPYGLLYRVLPDGIRILAVMSLSRRPLYWRGRR